MQEVGRDEARRQATVGGRARRSVGTGCDNWSDWLVGWVAGRGEVAMGESPFEEAVDLSALVLDVYESREGGGLSRAR